jgi:CRISPR/Cas system-associated exonuclease Cas4 (RecB family)
VQRSALLRSLEAATRAHPLERKVLVCSSRTYGTELLRALSATGAPWVGWTIATPWLLALTLVQDDVAANGELIADEFRIMRLADDAIDTVIAAGNTDLRAAIGSASFRDALHRAVSVLRSSGKRGDAISTDARILRGALQVLEQYELCLAREKTLDHAEVMRRALTKVQAGTRPWADARLFIAPTSRFGLRGELLDALLRSGGAELLQSERVHGLTLPEGLLRNSAGDDHESLSYLHASDSARAPASASIKLFAAATPTDELREVLRRIVESGTSFDRVEIIATDPRTYGNALYALARRLGIPLTMSNGVDLARTRTGRALFSYLAWLRDAFPAEALRIMLETGDIAGPDPPGVPGSRLAYRLRRLRIGWGKQRYYEIIERAVKASLTEAAANDEREPQEAERERERERMELRALRDLVLPILDAAPDAPPRLRGAETVHAPSAIAQGLLVFLDNVPGGDDSDSTVRQYVRERLERAVVELTRERSWETALAIIERVVDTRVTPEEDGDATWTSAPGRLHFSDLRNGGLSARPHTYIVGLDASRVAANAGVDPILTDSARRDLLGLPSARERAALRRYELAELLAQLRGEVTLSFSAWDATEGRAVPPAMELLQALRLLRGDSALTYTDLHAALGTLAGAVPQGHARLDTGDVWLAALNSANGVLHAATHLVQAAYPSLQRGQLARRSRAEHRFNPYHGKLSTKANTNRTFSATSLEALGTCPRRYFYRYLLRIDVPELIEFDPERWLDPRERGSLLHSTYENLLLRARELGVSYHDREFGVIAVAALREAVALTQERLPPPGDEVFQREERELQDDLRRFVKLIRRDQPNWKQLEFRFGDADRQLVVDTALGPMRLKGAIDRVDVMEDNRLLVIDYKTGRKYGYWPSRPFNGGRRIQHVVYSLAAARLLGEEVAKMEYHFPTSRGENEIVEYWPRQLGPLDEALARLLRVAAGDTFPTTDDPRDCKICDFAAVCRVKFDGYGRAESPLANWSKEVGLELADAEGLRFLRRVDG